MRFWFCFVSLLSLFSPIQTAAQSALSLEAAVEEGARHLADRFPQRTRIAVITVRAETRELGELVAGKISGALVNGGWFIVTERDAAALETIDREMFRHLSGEVSQETELSIGRQLGAEVLVSGSFVRSGTAGDANWRLELQAVTVETAQRAVQWSRFVRLDPVMASLVSTRRASLVFAGDTLSERGRAAVTTSLRNTMQNWSAPLELEIDDAASAPVGAGYIFTITVLQENLPANPLTNITLIQAKVSISFSRAGRVLVRGGPYMITEMTEAAIARRISERLSADRVFFDQVNAAIGN